MINMKTWAFIGTVFFAALSVNAANEFLPDAPSETDTTNGDYAALVNLETETEMTLEKSQGLCGSYFHGTGLKRDGRTKTRVDSQINFNWGGGRPNVPGIPGDFFSIQWTGKVKIDKAGTYTFHTLSDDGVRLWVNNKLLINDWNAHPPLFRAGKITLNPGSYNIRLDFFENGGGAVAKLYWSGPVGGRQLIPASNLTPGTPCESGDDDNVDKSKDVDSKLSKLPKNISWDDANKYCQRHGRELCTRDQYCPSGKLKSSRYGRQKGDQWAPSGDGPNSWVSIGDYDPKRRECILHHEKFGYPGWGTSRSSYYFKGLVACCGKKSEPTPSGTNGLCGLYFPNMNLKDDGNMKTRVDKIVNFNWGGGAPGMGIPSDRFSVRWLGKVVIEKPGRYTFWTLSDDGSRLWINNQLIINDWTNHAPKFNAGSLQLNKGTYDLKMELFENGGGAVNKLYWSGPVGGRQLIPEKNLLAGAPCVKASEDDDELVFTADNLMSIFVNGKNKGSIGAWTSHKEVGDPDFAPADKTNVIAFKAINSGGPAGVVVRGRFNKKTFVSDKNWRCSDKAQAGWEKPDFVEDSSWEPAHEITALGSGIWSTRSSATKAMDNDKNVKWIWTKDWGGNGDRTVFCRLHLSGPKPSPPKPKDDDEVIFAADDNIHLFINGEKKGYVGAWNQHKVIDKPNFRPINQANVLAVQATNGGGPGGILVRARFNKKTIVSNKDWKCTDKKQNGWEKPEFKEDANWKPATEIAALGSGVWGTRTSAVKGMDNDKNVKWIWTKDWQGRRTVYCRLQLSEAPKPKEPVHVSGKSSSDDYTVGQQRDAFGADKVVAPLAVSGDSLVNTAGNAAKGSASFAVAITKAGTFNLWVKSSCKSNGGLTVDNIKGQPQAWNLPKEEGKWNKFGQSFTFKVPGTFNIKIHGVGSGCRYHTIYFGDAKTADEVEHAPKWAKKKNEDAQYMTGQIKNAKDFDDLDAPMHLDGDFVFVNKPQGKMAGLAEYDVVVAETGTHNVWLKVVGTKDTFYVDDVKGNAKAWALPDSPQEKWFKFPEHFQFNKKGATFRLMIRGLNGKLKIRQVYIGPADKEPGVLNSPVYTSKGAVKPPRATPVKKDVNVPEGKWSIDTIRNAKDYDSIKDPMKIDGDDLVATKRSIGGATGEAGEYDVTVPRGGVYYLWGKTKCSGGHNSFWVDDLAGNPKVWHVPNSNNYEWHKYDNSFEMKDGGTFKLRFRGREDMCRLNQLFFSKGEPKADSPVWTGPKKPAGDNPTGLVKASLKVYISERSRRGVWNLYKNLAKWDGKTVTWKTAPSYNKNDGIRFTGVSGMGWQEIDFTELAKYWIQHPDANYGFRIVANSADGAQFDSPRSKNRAPQLILQYEGGKTLRAPMSAENSDSAMIRSNRVDQNYQTSKVLRADKRDRGGELEVLITFPKAFLAAVPDDIKQKFKSETPEEKDDSVPLGMENGAILDNQLSASTFWRGRFDHGVSHGRLSNEDHGVMAWCANVNNRDQWYQVDLRQPLLITRIATQGRHALSQWVTEYYVSYSDDGKQWTVYKEDGKDVLFEANDDRDSVVANKFKTPFKARYVRVNPTKWHGHISMRMELYGKPIEGQSYCPAVPVGVNQGAKSVGDSLMTASSIWSRGCDARYGRLDNERVFGRAWCARSNNRNQWLQINFGRPITVTRVGTQGRYTANQWVTKYSLEYSQDGKGWETYKQHDLPNEKEFNGNSERFNTVYNDIKYPFKAKFIRFRPIAWVHHISMRAEVWGHTDEDCGGAAIKAGEEAAKAAEAAAEAARKKAAEELAAKRKAEEEAERARKAAEAAAAAARKKAEEERRAKLKAEAEERARKKREEEERLRRQREEEAKSLKTGGADVGELVDADEAGMANTILPNSAFSASSVASGGAASAARLGEEIKPHGAWIPAKSDKEQYLQVDLGAKRRIHRIATQGNAASTGVKPSWVTKYSVSYSNDGKEWFPYREGGTTREFMGNADAEKIQMNTFELDDFAARFVRINPIEWRNAIALRAELYIGNVDRTPLQEAIDVEDSWFSASSSAKGFEPAGSELDANHVWKAAKPSADEWLQVDLQKSTFVDYVVIQGSGSDAGFVRKVKIGFSADGSNFKFSGVVDGNYDGDNKNAIKLSVDTRYVRVYTQETVGAGGLRIAIYTVDTTVDDEDRPVGLSTGAVTDDMLSASSFWRSHYVCQPAFGRLGEKRGAQAWCADDSRGLTTNEWLQIDMGKLYVINKVATQGRGNYNQWVTKYKLMFSEDGKTFSTYSEGGREMKFIGNKDTNGIVYHELGSPFKARYVRFNPIEWANHISMRAEVFGHPVEGDFLPEPVGVQSGVLEGKQMTASSVYKNRKKFAASVGRLGNERVGGTAWIPNTKNNRKGGADKNPWIQLDLDGVQYIDKVATQGRHKKNQWVTEYRLLFSPDGDEFQAYSKGGKEVIFNANKDRDTVVVNVLDPPVKAAAIRFAPVDYKRFPAMRVEAYGHDLAQEDMEKEMRDALEAERKKKAEEAAAEAARLKALEEAKRAAEEEARRKAQQAKHAAEIQRLEAEKKKEEEKRKKEEEKREQAEKARKAAEQALRDALAAKKAAEMEAARLAAQKAAEDAARAKAAAEAAEAAKKKAEEEEKRRKEEEEAERKAAAAAEKKRKEEEEEARKALIKKMKAEKKAAVAKALEKARERFRKRQQRWKDARKERQEARKARRAAAQARRLKRQQEIAAKHAAEKRAQQEAFERAQKAKEDEHEAQLEDIREKHQEALEKAQQAAEANLKKLRDSEAAIKKQREAAAAAAAKAAAEAEKNAAEFERQKEKLLAEAEKRRLDLQEEAEEEKEAALAAAKAAAEAKSEAERAEANKRLAELNEKLKAAREKAKKEQEEQERLRKEQEEAIRKLKEEDAARRAAEEEERRQQEELDRERRELELKLEQDRGEIRVVVQAMWDSVKDGGIQTWNMLNSRYSTDHVQAYIDGSGRVGVSLEGWELGLLNRTEGVTRKRGQRLEREKDEYQSAVSAKSEAIDQFEEQRSSLEAELANVDKDSESRDDLADERVANLDMVDDYLDQLLASPKCQPAPLPPKPTPTPAPVPTPTPAPGIQSLTREHYKYPPAIFQTGMEEIIGNEWQISKNKTYAGAIRVAPSSESGMKYHETPKVLGFLQGFAVSRGENLNLRSGISDVTPDHFKMSYSHLGTGMSWLSYKSYPTLSSGSITYAPKSWALSGGEGPRSFSDRVTFSTPYESVPTVVVGLTACDAVSEKGPRLFVFAKDVDVTGFTIVVHTWGSSVVESASVSWLAVEKNHEITGGQLSLSRTTKGIKIWGLDKGEGSRITRQYVAFPYKYDKVPTISLALQGFEFETGFDYQTKIEAHNVTEDGFELVAFAYSDTRLDGLGASWIAHTN